MELYLSSKSYIEHLKRATENLFLCETFTRGNLIWWKNTFAWEKQFNGTLSNLSISHKYVFTKTINLTDYEVCCTFMMIHKYIHLQKLQFSSVTEIFYCFLFNIVLECQKYLILHFNWSNWQPIIPVIAYRIYNELMATQFSKFWKTIYGKFSKHYNKLIFEFFYEIFPLKTIIYIILKLYKHV